MQNATRTTFAIDDLPNDTLAAECVLDVDEGEARRLEASGRFRFLRRLEPDEPSPLHPSEIGNVRIGVIVDTETTGLVKADAEVIEIAAVAFTYDTSGIGRLIGTFEGLQQPSGRLSADITRLTGLTDADLRGQSIDGDALARFLEPADLVIAHNAAFDRPFCETLHPVFKESRWACSVTDVDWTAFGSDSAKLASLLASVGLFHTGHRAMVDCHALMSILTAPRYAGPAGAFAQILAAATCDLYEVRAEGAPYSSREILKSRGYRWSAGADGLPKAWVRTVAGSMLEHERRYLRVEVYRDGSLPVVTRLDSRSRFR